MTGVMDMLGVPPERRKSPDWEMIYRRLREREGAVSRFNAGSVGDYFVEGLRPLATATNEAITGWTAEGEPVNQITRLGMLTAPLLPQSVGAAAGMIQGMGAGPSRIARNPPLQTTQAGRALDKARFEQGSLGQVGYHGSPHEFTQFSDTAIGTGEGAQAYGYGHYFADRLGTAKGYQKGLSTRNIGGGVANWDDPAHVAAGRLYKTGLNVTDDTMLHWDKPLSEQPKAVQEALKPWVDDVMRASGKTREQADAITGDTMYSHIAGRQFEAGARLKLNEPKKEAAEILRKAGIKGIKYLDQGSRAPGGGAVGDTAMRALNAVSGDAQKAIRELEKRLLQGNMPSGSSNIEGAIEWLKAGNKQTYNYVVFDPKDTQILNTMGP